MSIRNNKANTPTYTIRVPHSLHVIYSAFFDSLFRLVTGALTERVPLVRPVGK